MKHYRQIVTFMILALNALVFAGCGGGGGGGAPAATTTDAIVFMSYSSGRETVWGMYPDGSQKSIAADVADGKGSAIQGCLSPNGRKILYVKQLSGTGSQIIEQDINTDVQTVLITDSLSTGNDFAPSYSHDGTKIAYHDERDGIHVMNVDGTGDILLPGTTTSDHSPSWNGSGTKIVFDRGWNGSIYVMNPDGTGQTEVITQTATNSYGHPRFLPDGRIICTRWGTSRDIVMVNADGSGMVNLTPDTDTTNEFFPTINRDGTKITFATDRNEENDIYVGTLSGATITNLTNITADRDIDCWRPSLGVVDTTYINP